MLGRSGCIADIEAGLGHAEKKRYEQCSTEQIRHAACLPH
jgi:hypothetical protein